MSLRRWILVCLPALWLAQPAWSLQALDDGDLSEVHGREGVLLSFNYFLNTDPLTAEKLDNFCDASYQNCLFTWQVAGRGEGERVGGLAGEWLVYKEGYASLQMKRMALDASFMGEASSAGAGYESWLNLAKFQDQSGTCLLEGSCTVENIKVMPALKTYYPETGGSYDAATKHSSGYDDVRLGIRFERLSVEYDSPGVPGYTQDRFGSFMGLSIQDNNGPQAGIAFGGKFYMYGF
ncbi:hypothetical protein [Isoalcanivorax beigongshangi]|uniref:Uncharacterized protein n=1 Tax=Isoalcanivorax beigongshangi TaxID=3238810 RepID=A0ABV4AGN9_9GAMM